MKISLSSPQNTEFEQVRSQVKSEIEEVEKNAQTLVLEHLHSAAYSTGIGARSLGGLGGLAWG